MNKAKRNDWRKAFLTKVKAGSSRLAADRIKKPPRAIVPVKATNKAKKNKKKPMRLVAVGSIIRATNRKRPQLKMVKIDITHK
jgi:hypothetical protein